MRNIIIALVAVVLLTTNAFALDVIVQNAQLYKNAKQYTDELTKQGLKVRLENGTPASKFREIGAVESVRPTGRVPKGHEVVVTVFTSTRQVPMDNLVGSKQEETEKFLAERGIPFTTDSHVNAVVKMDSNGKPISQPGNCPVGTVGIQSPQHGTMYTPGTKIVLTLCLSGVAVQNVIGKSITMIKSDHSLESFKLELTGQPYYATSKVVRQNPAAGTVAAKGSTVTLECVSGPVTVENYMTGGGPGFWDAINTGHTPLTIEFTGKSTGKIVKQSIPPGTSVPYGTVIKLERQ